MFKCSIHLNIYVYVCVCVVCVGGGASDNCHTYRRVKTERFDVLSLRCAVEKINECIRKKHNNNNT